MKATLTFAGAALAPIALLYWCGAERTGMHVAMRGCICQLPHLQHVDYMWGLLLIFRSPILIFIIHVEKDFRLCPLFSFNAQPCPLAIQSYPYWQLLLLMWVLYSSYFDAYAFYWKCSMEDKNSSWESNRSRTKLRITYFYVCFIFNF